jgi:zinc protease
MMGLLFNRSRRLLSLVLSAGIITLSVPVGLADSITPRIIETKLPTGQTLYIKEDHSQPIVTIDTWVKTGSVNETDAINGVSHFLEHLLFKGTATRKPGELDRLLESRGAEFNAATSDDFTHYYITTASPYFEEALRLHADMLLNAAIPASELPQERKVVQEEINRANDNPSRQIYTELSKMLYGTHGYAMDTLGPKENIANIPRESILEYYHYWYQPQNFNTIVVGDVNPEQVKKLVAEVFPAPPFQRPKNYTPPAVGPVTTPTGMQVKVIENPSLSQSYLAIAMLGPAQQNPQDVYALDIAMLALGSGKSSRLYQALKERKPLATTVGAGNYTQKYSGMLVISAQSNPENREAVKQELIRQLVQLKSQGITPAELEKAKTQYLKDFIFENETTGGVANSLGYNVTIGSFQDYLNHVSNVEKVSLESVRDALNRYLRFDQAAMIELLPSSLKANIPAETEHNRQLLLSAQTEAHPAAAAAQLAEPQAERPEPQKTVLPNGITLITKPVPDSSTVAIKVFIHGGQGIERIPGTAVMAGSLLMQGTQNRSAEEISRELECKGMNLSIGADDDYIEVTGTAVREDFGELFSILGDVLTRPAFAEAEIAKKREQLKQAILASRDTPSNVAFENLGMALYPNHPYGNKGRRIEENLDKISREDLLSYYREAFVPQNMVVAVVGNFDPESLRSALNSLYPACKNCPPRKTAIPAVPPLTQSKVVTEQRPQLSATWLAQGWLAPDIRNRKDMVALKVLNSLLGSGMSSRLFVSLREKQGLAYAVASMFPSREQASRFVIYMGTDPVNTERAKAGFAREIKRLQTERVPEKELQEAKSKLIGSFALSHDTNVQQAYYLGIYETLGAGYQFDREFPKLVEQVTAADIQRVAQKYLSAPSVLSIVEPQKPAQNTHKHE